MRNEDELVTMPDIGAFPSTSSQTANSPRKKAGLANNNRSKSSQTDPSAIANNATPPKIAVPTKRGLRTKEEKLKVTERPPQMPPQASSNEAHQSLTKKGLRQKQRQSNDVNMDIDYEFDRDVLQENEVLADPEPGLEGSTEHLIRNNMDPSLRRTFSVYLVEATPILNEDESQKNIDKAQPVDLEAMEEERWQRQKQFRRKIVAGCALVLLIIGAVVLAITLAGNNSAESKEIFVRPTEPPTAAPTSVLNSLFESLPDYTRESLQDPASAQFRAYKWLLDHPNITNFDDWRKLQIFAMITFYYAFEGPHWSEEKFTYGWLDIHTPECEWYPREEYGESSGFCDYGSEERHVIKMEFRNPGAVRQPICNDLGQLTLLSLQSLRLSSYSPSVPPEISLLSSLETIYLYGNDINKTTFDLIPSQMGSLSNLTTLRLDHNYYLHGSIVTDIGRLTSLMELDLSENVLTSNIPSQIGLLKEVETLYLYQNILNGAIPSEIGLLTSLRSLSLRDNSLTDSIISEIGRLSLLKDLFLYNNDLQDIPTEIGLLQSLATFYGAKNSLTDWIPSEMGMLKNMTILHLHENQLQGTLPSDIGRLSALERLSVRGNDLTGIIPSEIGQLSGVVSLFLNGNSFSGTIPISIGELQAVQYLYLEHNKLSGSLPQTLGSLSSVNWLYLHNNLLTGTIPNELASLFRLPPESCRTIRLSLANNNLTGFIPSEIGLSTGLQYLDLFGNKISGQLPSEMTLLTALESLNLSQTNLSGTIPDFLCGLSSLKYDCSDSLLCGCDDCSCAPTSL